MLRDVNRVRLILAHARGTQNLGKELQSDVEKWLVRWADDPSVDESIVREFALDVVHRLESEPMTFDWIACAGRIRASDRLTKAVESVEPLLTRGSLSRYVLHRLQNLSAEDRALWMEKRNAFLIDLASFVPDLNAEERTVLYEITEPDALTPDGREGAVILCLSMMQTDENDYGRWAIALNRLVELGATGCGTLGAYLDRLPTGYAEIVGNNLIVTLYRRIDLNTPEVVRWIARTIIGAKSVRLPDLEVTLCTLLTSRHRRIAISASDALMQIAAHDQSIIQRNFMRIDCARRVIDSEDRAGFMRQSSRFVANIAKLAAMTPVADPPTLPIQQNSEQGPEASPS